MNRVDVRLVALAVAIAALTLPLSGCAGIDQPQNDSVFGPPGYATPVVKRAVFAAMTTAGYTPGSYEEVWVVYPTPDQTASAEARGPIWGPGPKGSPQGTVQLYKTVVLKNTSGRWGVIGSQVGTPPPDPTAYDPAAAEAEAAKK
jgi:hypothetical protein